MKRKEKSMETATIKNTDESGIEAPKAIGGWLKLLGLLMIISPIKSLYLLYVTFVPLFTDGAWEALTSIDSEQYLPIWGPLLVGEMVFNSAITISIFYVAYLFFYKKASFPIWYVSIAAFSIVFIIADDYVFSTFLSGMPMFGKETVTEISKSLVPLLILTPYLFISKRSKATFTQ